MERANAQGRRKFYGIFRVGMVLVAGDYGSGWGVNPAQDKIYEMVAEAHPGEKGKQSWEMGG